MNDSTMPLIALLMVLILMSAYFSATETAFTTLNKIRMKNMAGSGNKKARLALELSEDYDRLLSTILIGNNIVNIASASLATILFVAMLGEDLGVSISTLVMTILVLIFGEISPKSIAKDMPEQFAMFSAPILKFFIKLLAPLNFFFVQWKKLLSHLFHTSAETGITEEELLTMVEEAHHDGGIDEQESELIRSAIEFNDLDAIDIVTPRIRVTAIEIGQSEEEISKTFLSSGYTRLPVYQDSIDNILGFLHQKDFYRDVVTRQKKIDAIIKPIVFIPPSTKISKLLKQLQQNRSHMAVITDEFGGTVGIVTLEDIIEELVGEIWDEHDEVIETFEKLSDQEYRVAGSANLDKIAEYFNLSPDTASVTVNGWLMEAFGRIPGEGETLTVDNLTITVLKADTRKISEVRITLNETKAAS
ncbi:hemolysin family protein [Anaerolentibacter hominis]|uniref:HlyC/CorC family transporter n=1 Tax=Anaerolentibacter hominis TaxID=3079009 RepID=UPI0031B86A9E